MRQLAVGTVSTQVVVNTDVPLLNTESGAVTTTLSYEDHQPAATGVSRLGRIGPASISCNRDRRELQGETRGQRGQVTSNGTMLSVNGNLPFSTVLADGAETTLPASANSDITVQEDIQEVQTSSSAFSAQYGVGGILYNQISKGGGDRFHGSAYEYFQNTALNANNYTFGSTATKPQIHFHEFGGTVGGPILRQKLFFFFNYDHIIDNGGSAASFYTTPTPAELSGNFAGLPTIYDPATTTVFQQTGTYTLSRREYTDRLPLHQPHALPQQPDSGRPLRSRRQEPARHTFQLPTPLEPFPTAR